MNGNTISLRIKSAGLAIALSLGMIIPAHAQQTGLVQELTISPTDSHYDVDPGKVVNDQLTILNSGQTTLNLSLYTAPYSVEDESYKQNFEDTSQPRADAQRWISLSRTDLSVGPRETVRIPYVITVPDSASPGGHYGAIFAEIGAEGDSGSIARKKRVGSLVYVNVSGDVRREGTLSTDNISAFQTAPPLRASIVAKNTGNTDYMVTTAFSVKNVFDKTIHEQRVENYILPETTRTIPIEWTDSPWAGIYKVNLSSEALGQSSKQESYVVIIPKWLIFAVVLVIILGVLNAYRQKTRRR